MNFANVNLDEMQDYFNDMKDGGQDGYGYTLLHYLYRKQSHVIISYLLLNQKNIFLKQNYTLEEYINENINVLPESIEQFEYYMLFLDKITQFLSKQCTQGIHVIDIDSYTPLYHAIFYYPYSIDAVQILMKHGANKLNIKKNRIISSSNML